MSAGPSSATQVRPGSSGFDISLIVPEAHLLALEALGGPLGEERKHLVYNIGNGHGFTVQQVIESVRRVTGREIPVELCDRRPGDPAVLVASSAAIQRELGWIPRHSHLDDIIGSAWRWHQSLHA